MKGKVQIFNEIGMYGFILGEDGKVYYASQVGLKLSENDEVTFNTEEGKAFDVSKVV